MTREKYATVKIPAELASKLDTCCRNWGYRSRAEMVDDAIRRFIAGMNQETQAREREAAPRVLVR